MTTIAATLTGVALQVSVSTPASWVTATDDEHVQIRDVFLRQTVDDILDRLDLPSPIGAQTTITGDGSASYDLPAGFLRMKRSAWSAYETGLLYPCTQVPSAGEFEYIKDRGIAGAERYFHITGYDGSFDVEFYRAPAIGVTILMSYMTGYWMATAGGTAGTAFTSETDVLLLPRDLVEAGTLFRYRRRHGLGHEPVQAEYEAKMSRYASNATGRRSVMFGDQPLRKPWEVPLPDYIPSS